MAKASMASTAEQEQDTAGVERVELRLAPEDIAINPVFSSLRADRDSVEYELECGQLGKTMLEVGQQVPVLIRDNTTGSPHAYELVAGHRRYKAATLHELELLCRYEDMDDAQAMRVALLENFQREDFNDMDKARIILGLRVDGKMRTKQIAEYLGVSTATVTETEKLLELPQEVQVQVEKGELSKSAALEVAPVKPEKRKEVVERAKRHAEDEQEQAQERREAKVRGKGRGAGGKGVTGAGSGKKQGSTDAKSDKPVKVQGKHVRKAVREVEGAVQKQRAPNRAAILDMFEALGRSSAGTPRMAMLARVVVGWIRGKTSDKDMRAVWNGGQGATAGMAGVAIPAKAAVKKAKAEQIPKAKAKVTPKPTPKPKDKRKAPAPKKKK